MYDVYTSTYIDRESLIQDLLELLLTNEKLYSKTLEW